MITDIVVSAFCVLLSAKDTTFYKLQYHFG